MRLGKLFTIFSHNANQTQDAITRRERELDDERRLTRMSRREAIDKLFAAVLDDPKEHRQ